MNNENRNSSGFSERCVANMADIDRIQIEGLQQNASAINRPVVHFRNGLCAQPTITMGVQNRNRSHRNRLSDIMLNNNSSPNRSVDNRSSLGIDNNRALSLELHNAILNFQTRGIQNSGKKNSSANPGDRSSSTTDIGESSTSAESLTSSPESPNYETDNVTLTSAANTNTVHTSEADTTVKRFFDRHFGGPMTSGRRYPTTMSQSWTSSQNSSPFQNFKQSVSMCAFPASEDNVTHPVIQNAVGSLANLPRSKSEHLKTNGSLINQPFNSVIVPAKSHAPQAGRVVRVAYKDAEEISMNERINRNQRQVASERRNNEENRNSMIDRSFDTDVFDSASNVSSLAAAILDPGDIIVTKRQDELRNLRLSHLLSQPYVDNEHGHGCNHRHLHRSLSENSLDSSNLSFSPVTGDRTVAVLRSDAKYPTNCLQSSTAVPNGCISYNNQPIYENETSSHSQISRNSSSSSVTGCSSANQNTCVQNQGNQSTPRKQNFSRDNEPSRVNDNAMVHSWHAGVSDNSNSKLATTKTNTIGRNVNSNFEKKPLGDKDVINILFPHYKQTKIENDIMEDKRFVPSSEMRASASQRYNYETEDNQGNRNTSRRKNLFKRHSTGCFPTKHEHVANRANPQRQKSSQERQLMHRQSDSASDNRRSTSRDRKSHRRPVSYERDNSLIMTENNKKHFDTSHPYLMHSAIPKDFSLLDRGLYNSKPERKDSKVDKRSRSLGRKKTVVDSKSGSTGRKKAGTSQSSSFYTELEHVLERQQSARGSSPSKSCRHLCNNGDRGNSAITQV